ncbi:MAG: glycine cleavage system protein GcvH [Spirochaetales bacterium]|nr:glycine cleavage system protein GcvH [Spirochaetales bacterium]
MEYKDNVRYQDSHEWARIEGDVAVIGISDYAQDSLGDVVFVEFPDLGKNLTKGQAFGVVESVKAASDVFMPMTGEIIEINVLLKDNPEKINQDPFGDGWIMKVKISQPDEYDTLMSAADYQEYVKGLD